MHCTFLTFRFYATPNIDIITRLRTFSVINVSIQQCSMSIETT